MLSVVGLKESEHATTAETVNKPVISLMRPPRSRYPEGKTGGERPARSRAPNVIIAILEDVPAQILILHDPEQPLPDSGSVEHDVLDGIIGQLEEHFLEQRREHRVQPPGSDVLHALVYLGGDTGDLFDAIGGELERRAVGRTESRVLFGQRVLGLRHDADEVRFSERRQLHADREATLELRDQIARLGDME